MARNRFRGRGVVTPRLTEWFELSAGGITSTAVGGTIVASLNAAALALRPFTVVRQYYELMVRSDQAAAIEVQVGAFGVCVVSDQASGIGVTAVPTPVTDAASDLWMLHQWFMADASTLTDRTIGAGHYSVSSKAMRKVNGDEDVVIVQEFDASGSGFTLTSAGRLLVKLH